MLVERNIVGELGLELVIGRLGVEKVERVETQVARWVPKLVVCFGGVLSNLIPGLTQVDDYTYTFF